MKFTVSEGPASILCHGLRWSADGQDGYRWEVSAGTAVLYGVRNGQETAVDAIPDVPVNVGDVFEFRAFGLSHYVLRNSVLAGKIDDTDGIGPGAVDGHIYNGLFASMRIDDFSCGNLGAASASDPEGLATFLESEGWTVALSGTVFTVDPGQVFTWQEAVEGVYASAILAPLRSDIDDFFGR
jgi:hypothetical protein